MSASYHPSQITVETFNAVLSRYPTVVPEKLKQLDALRYESIPGAKSSSAKPSLTKAELEKLVEWKLSHGKWRPKLQSLAASNADADVQSACRAAAEQLSSSANGSPDAQRVMAALDAVTKLKGVGPATASLVLSCLRPDAVPFFSDELFRWLCWDEQAVKGTSGWKRQIAYTKKEYAVLIERARSVLARLREAGQESDVDMLKLEKVAYVLRKEEVDINAAAAQLKDSKHTENKSKGGDQEVSGSKEEKTGSKRKRKAEAKLDEGSSNQPEDTKRARVTRSSSRIK